MADIGMIIVWQQESTIPSGWQICDGTNGTPDLRNKFVYGANNDTELNEVGGSENHSHSIADTSERAAHDHGGSKATNASGGGSVWVTTGTGTNAASTSHTHTATINITAANAHAHTISDTTSESILPPYIKLFFIMKIT